MNSDMIFKKPPFYKRIYHGIILWYKHLLHPENVWYGGGLKRETALHSVGDGWTPIINNLYDAKPKKTNVWQVKEKWGFLHFYVDSAPEWYHDLISFYENESAETCEQCGKKGKLRDDLGWILALCDEHYNEIKNKNNEQNQTKC